MTLHWLTILGGLLVSLLSICVLLWATVVVVTVENDSMMPALQEGDRALILRYWPARWLRKGQIVVVWPWYDHATKLDPIAHGLAYIKRIVGMPGDTITSSLDQLDPFHRERERAAHDPAGRRVWQVPAGHCFVRGDHPIGGWDSLSWGPIRMWCVLGVMILRFPRKKVS